jgi:hypothetical protein
MKEFEELAFDTSRRSPGITGELMSQAREYQELVRRKEASASASVDLTDRMKQVVFRLAELHGHDRSNCEKVDFSKDDFLAELGKENSLFATKLKPVLSWVDKISVNGDIVELHFNFPAEKDKCKHEKDKPQWLREGRLAKDITTHGLFLPEVLRFRFSEINGKTVMTGLKGLVIPVTVSDVPIKIDKIVVESVRLSLSGDRLHFEVETKNPAPFLGRLLKEERRRPNPVPSEVFVDDKGNLEMRETWKPKH